MSSGALHIHGGRPMRGRVRVPPDYTAVLPALVLAALGDGRSELPALPDGSDALRVLESLAALGVACEHGERLAIEGVGLAGLRLPKGALDCGSAWLGLGLLAGLLSGQQFGTRIRVHPSLAGRELAELVGPLAARGAQIGSRFAADGGGMPALAVAPLLPGEALRALDCSLSRSDPGAKSGVLISALYAAGPTTLAEPYVSADHTERLWVGLGLPVRRIGSVLAFDPSGWDRRVPPQRERELPGSASIAAYLASAAQLVPGSQLVLEGVGINPSRSAVLDVLRAWGGAVEITPTGDAALREPVGEVRLGTRPLRGGVLGAEELVRAGGEIAAFGLLAGASRRGVELFDLQAIAPQTAPPFRGLPELFRAFGFEVELGDDVLRFAPVPKLRPAHFDAGDSAELALAAAALGLASPGETVLEHASAALGRAYPGFIETARALGAHIEAA